MNALVLLRRAPRATVGRPSLLIALVLGAGISGCMAGEEDAAAPIWYSPITRRGVMELESPTSGADSQAACQVLEIHNTTRIHDISFQIAWTPREESMRSLTIRIHGPGGGVQNETAGESPLQLGAGPLNASKGDRVLFAVETTSRPLLTSVSATPSQEINFLVAFSWEVPPPDSGDPGPGMWGAGAASCEP